ncbi:MAG: DUF971 domain-containing protein [Pseudomonadota bacterium]
MTNSIPQDIVLHQQSRKLEVRFDDGKNFQLPYEYLRVFSPSAEVRGHGKGQEVLQTNKKNVGVVGIESVGNYAIKINFDDGHNTGLYTWDYLYELGDNEAENWQLYLQRLEEAGASRDG